MFLTFEQESTGLGRRGHRINLADVLSKEFEPRIFNGSWISDDQLVFRDKDGHLILYSIRMKSSKRILHNAVFKENRVQKYSMSADQKYVLLVYDLNRIYRYSFDARYKIYDLENKRIYHLWPLNKFGEKISLATWGPKGNQMAYVYKNNIYYVPKVNGTHYAVTNNGVEGIIFNGVPDWLYEEEILKSNRALWWSPDGNQICFATLNDTKTGIYYYNWYGNHNDSTNVLAQLKSIRYPKAGHENPTAVLWVVDVRSPSRIIHRDVKPPREVQDQLVHVCWIRHNHPFTELVLLLLEESLFLRLHADPPLPPAFRMTVLIFSLVKRFKSILGFYYNSSISA
ncbi:Inactive dipeptidyl peptidase 10 like protein [Argiope bruennichi]|uniref:Inactive dipeptidyl peptidase 10 like protein n=1 Tax=Argiope bruennichi TaxID=94029 RepID=A0A8T0FUX6_ARGBR|nr:Inactive dipeptidyl peptidase 10 like protein [Argiope bruennichi]